MKRDELAGWLRLTLTPGIGNQTARRLLAAFGLPEAIFSQSPSALLQVVTPVQADALREEPPELPAQLELTWHWLQNQEGGAPRQVLALGDANYPPGLLHIEDPPLLLYLMGQLELPLEPARSLAIVGSRNPTPQGALNARQFAQTLSQAGLTIVSGLALGVDGAAHEGALAGAAAARLATVAVVGTGLDRVYPKRHHQLAHDIAQRGLIVSEYPLGTPPLAANFPRRNQLIAGLSCATLVVEAALQSGSLITARLAAEQGKEVFAIPGSIHATQSHGCHALIRQGAKLVESAQDVLEDLPGAPMVTLMPAPPPPSPDDEDSLLRALGFDPVSLDALQARTGLATPQLQARLMTLELDGQVARLPGGLYQRIATT